MYRIGTAGSPFGKVPGNLREPLLCRTEYRFDFGSVGFEIGSKHQDVGGLQAFIAFEHGKQVVIEYFHLSAGTVTRIYNNRIISRSGIGTASQKVVFETTEKAVGTLAGRFHIQPGNFKAGLLHVAFEKLPVLCGCLSQRGCKQVGRPVSTIQQVEMHIPQLRKRHQQLNIFGRHGGYAEDGDPVGKFCRIDLLGFQGRRQLLLQGSTMGNMTVSVKLLPVFHQFPPKNRLPALGCLFRHQLVFFPCEQHLRAIGKVLVEYIRDASGQFPTADIPFQRVTLFHIVA